MRKLTLILFVALTAFLLLVSAAAAAETTAGAVPGMEGMDHEPGATQAAESMPGMDHENYKPPEQAADDSTMAAIVATIFSLPIGGWLVVRSVRKAKKNPK